MEAKKIKNYYQSFREFNSLRKLVFAAKESTRPVTVKFVFSSEETLSYCIDFMKEQGFLSVAVKGKILISTELINRNNVKVICSADE